MERARFVCWERVPLERFLLSGVMVVALLTAGIPDHHIAATWRGLLDLLYLPDWLLLLLLGWLICSGAGRVSLDQRLARRA